MQTLLFPLPLFLLPDGIARLQIFEPKYLELVKECAGKKPFALQHKGSKDSIAEPWACLVSIIDFSTAENGMLTIDIQGEKLVSVVNVQTVENEAARCDTKSFSHWQENSQLASIEDSKKLANLLRTVFEHNPNMANLYQTKCYGSHLWICRRWLEILPLPISVKTTLIQRQNYALSEQLLLDLLISQEH